MGDCFIYNNSAWRLCYCVGSEVRITHISSQLQKVRNSELCSGQRTCLLA